MSRSAFQRLEELFHLAADLPPAERTALLDRECAGEPELRAALEDMLRRDREAATEDGRLASPVARAVSDYRHDAPTLPAVAAAGPVRPALPHVPGYELLEELGRGGMGVVYKARQVGLNRFVALKMLLPFAAPTTEQLARFRTEAEALARLSHPNIVPIFEVGECAAGPYFSMEYIPGPSLGAYLDGRPCDPVAAAHLVEVLADAIQAVHQCGIVHRDLKPANVLLQVDEHESDKRAGRRRYLLDGPGSPGPGPKITDFGLAKDRSARKALTATGTTLGTPSYMAPEQVDARRGGVGPAVDIYALGAILYEMLTGRPPFDGNSPLQTLALVVHDDAPPLSRLRPGLPHDLVTICTKCLEKSPRRRYASARELALDLRHFQAHEPIRARPVGRFGRVYRWCRRRPLVAGLAALCTALVVAFVVTVLAYDVRLREALQQAQSKAEDEREQIVRLNVTIGLTEMDDGDYFAAVLRFAEALRQDAGAPERERTHRTRIGATLRQSPKLVRLLVPGKDLLCGRLTDSNARIATIDADNTIEFWDLESGHMIGQRLAHGPGLAAAAFSPDGRYLATVGLRGTARLWDLEDGSSQMALEAGSDRIRTLAYHPTGRLLLLGAKGSDKRLWDLTRGSVDAPLPQIPPGSDGLLSEDAQHLIVFGADGESRVWDVATGQPGGPPLKSPVVRVKGAISTNARRIAELGTDNGIRIADVDSGRWLGRVLVPGFAVTHLVFSPNGDKLLAAGPGSRATVWSTNSGEAIASLALPQGDVAFARFSPDGRMLVTGCEGSGARVWDTASGLPLTPPLRHGCHLSAAAFRADNGRLTTADADGTAAVWELGQLEPPEALPLFEADDGVLTGLAKGKPVCEITCASGKRLQLRARDGGLLVCDAATEEPVSPLLPVRAPVRFAALGADGGRLVIAGRDASVRVWDVASGEPLTPAVHIPHRIAGVAFDPSGDRVSVACADGSRYGIDLTPDTRSVDELVAAAQMLACGRVDRDQRRQPLDLQGLRAASEAVLMRHVQKK